MTQTQTGILGIDTLLGRDVKDVVEGRKTLGRLHAFAAQEEEVQVQQDTEAEIDTLEPLTTKAMSGLSALVLASSPAAGMQAYEMVKQAGGRPILIDCLGHLESRPEARIVSPFISEPEIGADWLFVVAHPVASALTLVLTRLSRLGGVRGSVANVFEPASERGKAGVAELSQQTTALLTFKKLNKAVFDTQISFNLLPRIGEDAAIQLLSTEARIDRHLATLLHQQGGGVAMPSVRVMQAPVFHGYSVSMWVEFESAVRAQEVEEALACAQIEIRSDDQEAPDIVGAVSQSGLMAGDIRIDRNHPRAVWIWIAMDNLRIVADEAADLLRLVPPQPPLPSSARKTIS